MQSIKKLLGFLWDCKYWWLVPMLIMGALFVLLLLSAGETGNAPFIYHLF